MPFYLTLLMLLLHPFPLWAQSTLSADFDGNGKVEFLDFLAFAQAFGSTESRFDFNGDSTVNFSDFLSFVQLYQQANPAPEPEPALKQTLVLTTSAGTRHIMLIVPEGEFSMGRDDGSDFGGDTPRHTVFLSDYYIDQFEVTNEQFAAFLNHIGRNYDPEIGEFTPLLTLGIDGVDIAFTTQFEVTSPSRFNRPVVGVTWFGARAYCRWIEGRLLSEAEWEKAARGTDGRAYPWGDAEPTAQLTNIGNQIGHSVDVGSYPAGISPYNVHDLVGNVWEWVSDWQDTGYYAISPETDPQGPEGGENRGLRGGSWSFGANFARSTFRGWGTPEDSTNQIGFRCARDP